LPSRIEPDAPLAVFAQAPSQPAAIAAILPDEDFDTALLPREHPKWVKDAMLVSMRARQLLARIKPVALRVLSFWDHAVRTVVLGGNRSVSVDSSGSYRLDHHS